MDALGDAALAARIFPKISPRARRLSLRVDAVLGGIVLVRPRKISDAAVAAFVASKSEWIAHHLAALLPRIPFADGAVIPFQGMAHVVTFRPQERGGVWLEDNRICIAGKPEHAPRRLLDWLKGEARSALSAPARLLAEKTGRNIARITVREARSRWGSCNRNGRLSFNWRLILAPDFVRSYVVAHEVAHLRHMNHGAAFWRTVDVLMADIPNAGDADAARVWLRREGASLYRYG